MERTPQFDFGFFIVAGVGLLGRNFGHPLGLGADVIDEGPSGGILVSGSLTGPFAANLALNNLTQDEGNALFQVSGTNVVWGHSGNPLANGVGTWILPGKLTGVPIKVVVSQDGTTTGADPASTQGSAVLYLVTATPT